MKWTKSMIQTLRDNPQDAEIDSHKLLVRAGIVKKLAGGLYTYLPLGMRSLKKVQEIIRQEMDRGAPLRSACRSFSPPSSGSSQAVGSRWVRACSA